MVNVGGTGHWRIEARAFGIFNSRITHNFWILVDYKGNVVDQIHGLAVNPETGHSQEIGSSKDLLQVVNGEEFPWAIQIGQPTVICAAGVKDAIVARWDTAVKAGREINALKLRYPDLTEHLYKANSNTVFNTIGQIMGFDVELITLNTIAPGFDKVISQDIINKYRYKGVPGGKEK